MTPERRGVLWARAFPAGGVTRWRQRMWASVAVAILMVGVGEAYVAALMLLSAAPTWIRYLRREVALGLLLRAGHEHDRQVASVPLRDLRT